jgi:pimeloyl-ACP methyl ester carboxylesterase
MTPMIPPLALALSFVFAVAPVVVPIQEPPAAPPAAQGEHEKKVERVVLTRGEKKLAVFMELTLADPDPATPMIVLYHQARSGKAEYRPIVPRLKELGYNCLAVDLCCGGEARGVRNVTAKNAHDGGKNPTYLDAIPDIVDSLLYAREHYAHGKLIAWGSSYSSSLCLVEAVQHPDVIDGVIAFSPGEYFTAVGKSATWVQEEAKDVACPVFVTSAKNEASEWKAIFDALGTSAKTSFLPESAGTHGSSALWEESPGNAEYWTAVEAFLKQNFPPPAKTPTPPKDG